MKLARFNAAAPDDAGAALRPCLDVDRWVDEMMAARPYADVDALIDQARTAAAPLTTAEIDAALAHHPRIGERSADPSPESDMSAAEQAALGATSPETEAELADGNRDYEARFGRVFLIRAAGRSREDILAELHRRMANSAADELDEIADQLRQIAVHRLEGVITR